MGPHSQLVQEEKRPTKEGRQKTSGETGLVLARLLAA
jgi:hypothetical protein